MRSAFPSGTEWVSKSSLPMRVDFPWSTWPTTTSWRWSDWDGLAAGVAGAAGAAAFWEGAVSIGAFMLGVT